MNDIIFERVNVLVGTVCGKWRVEVRFCCRQNEKRDISQSFFCVRIEQKKWRESGIGATREYDDFVSYAPDPLSLKQTIELAKVLAEKGPCKLAPGDYEKTKEAA